MQSQQSSEVPVVRRRRPEDVDEVVALMLRQQPLTRYPLRSPLPFPPEEFVARPHELAAWVAELPGRSRVGGHVSVLEVADTEIGRSWSAAAGRPRSELGAVGVLVVDHELTGRGLGRRLLGTAVDHLAQLGRTPVLEVLEANGRALAMYRSQGWEEVGTARPEWLPVGEPPVRLMLLRG